ncbi:MAG: hypothetical protein ACOX4A_10035 [Saccharofermentanales bacterium]
MRCKVAKDLRKDDSAVYFYRLFALLSLLILLEPMFMKLERITLSSLIDLQNSDSDRRNSAFVPGNSDAVEPLRLLFFTDVHARWLRVPRRAIRRAFAQAAAADNVSVVLFGGDLINDRYDVKRGLKVLGRLARPFSIIRSPLLRCQRQS